LFVRRVRRDVGEREQHQGKLLVTGDSLHSHKPLARLIRAKVGRWLDRGITLSALRLAGHTNISKVRRATAADPGLVLRTIAMTSPNTISHGF
jgi:hypothetical protein